MSTSAPSLPDPLRTDWRYEDALRYEAALQAHMQEYGPGPEPLFRLALSATGRCAYQLSVRCFHQALSMWPEFDRPFLGVNGRLTAIQAALHGGANDVAEHWVRDLAAHSEIVTSQSASVIAQLARGTGLQEDLVFLLRRCLSFLDPSEPLANVLQVLVNDYGEVSQLARQVRLVSLGSGCYPWLQLNRFMLRHADNLDLQMPFNLSVTIEGGVTAALEDELAGFSEPTEYESVSIVRGIPCPRHKRYSVLFNHDCDDEFHEAAFSKLRALCASRASAFIRCIRNQRIVFVSCAPQFAQLKRLESAVAELTGHDRYRLLILAHQHDGRPDWPHALMPTTRAIHVPFPLSGYNWTLQDHTPEGYAFDLAVRDAVLSTMRDLAAQ